MDVIFRKFGINSKTPPQKSPKLYFSMSAQMGKRLISSFAVVKCIFGPKMGIFTEIKVELENFPYIFHNSRSDCGIWR